MGGSVSTNHKSSNRIELSRLGQDLSNGWVCGWLSGWVSESMGGVRLNLDIIKIIQFCLKIYDL